MLLLVPGAPLPFSPALLLNGVALLFAIAGSWLLLATRLREQRALARLAGERELDEEGNWALEAATVRINRFFYRFGAGTLLLALLLSWSSTRL
ncbi:hypothetical protein AvCA_41300 [Azotobacter vinelandii CA]|uniref:Uncharacterized protein n=2 Tax=Azotobacter vinelandii TaxID=354 RepID=C1DET4_AZOVD|nr:hypothetical protein [Azotobacter vinelandii]ACO80263.1 hypothetical protein Avin_41300 [Azotobacter vinelandii DJ]AGK16050.1 hypothetical protein AvCA_41300 [Azotobacter vinelandii CA]AGK21811.1 hypothetical protein AvCA6_41300 [Azotobacter vinelandii CA6]SFX72051.1 hypothetical protein SAMN04244547_02511 [Azotobacter vinelandii]GLK61778.1 hypothetical protein GCM10017624_39420 [Azotobacter vinelandii]